MDVRFCEGRNHRREAQMRAGVLAIVVLARSSVARVRRMLFPLDKDLHGCRLTARWKCPLGFHRMCEIMTRVPAATAVLPKRIVNWSLTSLQQRLVKTGGRLVKHARYYWLLLAAT